MKPTMVTRMVGQLVVLRENDATPTDSEWDAFLKILADNWDKFDRLKILVVTDGGGPNAAQRKRLEGVLNAKPIRVAVVTDSAKSRFIASMISLINRQHMGFAMKELVQAYNHLRLTQLERTIAEQALAELSTLIK
jgi:hypothetical protein